MHPIKIDIIGYDSGWGCQDYRCEDGPYKIPADSLLYKLRSAGVTPHYHPPMGLKFLGDHEKLKTKEETLPLVVTGLRRLCQQVKQSIENGGRPVVIGGDHTSAIGTWAGAVAATNSHQRFGLIWIDAHLDSHTYDTSWQGKWGGWWHGQPVSALTGQGLPELISIGGRAQKISPEHISIIGPHNFEPAEQEFVVKNKIRVYFLDEVKRRGFKAIFEESLQRATTGTEGFGITIDLDAFQPSDAPGVGAAENDGLAVADVLPIIKSVGLHPAFRALEVAEYNPHKDIDHKTARLAENIIAAAFTKIDEV